MSSYTEDTQLIAIGILITWMMARVIATIIGWLPWSGWIVAAMLASALASAVWISSLEDHE